ncbi:hypothetical protein [Legionella maioricensis]|uniref:Flagellar biosynthetic protein FliO n=1 Tax=Legionella maioricensis TaxID=2896528 RepID=A0A9X2IAL2_9GAMM|nr:hypothetical protein [Legionella maioricensis]MCL9682642.1 hypothetical protein [Legionella maioricensis]MCL9687311.1 hypothetical protein [Legionella maioricensis]
MRQLTTFILIFLVNPLFAEETINFKKELVTTVHWFPYGIVLILLFIALLLLAKNSKKVISTNAKCKIIERIAVHHKTKVYVIVYQGQKFLVADNQNSLAIHALQETSSAYE